MNLSQIDQLGPLCGQCLNPEEISGLEVAMVQRKLQENLQGEVKLWGKITGSKQDYLIVFHVEYDSDFPRKKFYFCTTSDYVLRAIPSLSPEYELQAKNIATAFLGDPSFFSYGAESEETEDPEGPPVERFREIHRLANVIERIDHDCFLVPRGALGVDVSKRIVVDSSFKGISFDSSKSLRTYMHFRQPENAQCQALLKRPGLLKSDDFLDSIDKDVPSQMWTVAHDTMGSQVFVRNLFWPGYCFFARLNGSEFGSIYVGTGCHQQNIVFGL